MTDAGTHLTSGEARAESVRVAARYPDILSPATPRRLPGLEARYATVVTLRHGAVAPSDLGDIIVIEGDEVPSTVHAATVKLIEYDGAPPELWNMPRTVDDAVELDAPLYFTGQPCSHGHISPRRTIGRNCVECARIRKQTEAARGKPARESRHGQQRRKLLQMLGRPEGATVDEMTAALAIQKHSVRSALSVLSRTMNFERGPDHRYRLMETANPPA